MPTRALPERAGLLRRALASVLGQEGVRAVPLLVVNGPDRDPDLCRALEADRRCRVLYASEASLPAALALGRERVDTPWFAELDDDDEYLPGALAQRLAAIADASAADVVVTNGYRRSAAGDLLQVSDARPVRADPLRALLAGHWLMPGSYLCRTETVGPDLFAGMPAYLENTYLAVRLAIDYRFVFLDEPTMVRYLDTQRSESKSLAYVTGQVDALRRILALELPQDVRAAFAARIADTCHTASVRFLALGDRRTAWRWHLRSLVARDGWRYLPYTRRLVLPVERPA